MSLLTLKKDGEIDRILDITNIVTTKHTNWRVDISKHIRNQVQKAKDIHTVFNRLKKQNWIVDIKPTGLRDENFTCEIYGTFKGIHHYVKVDFDDNQSEYFDGNFKQSINKIIY